MRTTAYSIVLILASAMLLLSACGASDNQEKSQDVAASYPAQVDAWHAERIERLQSEGGWLTLVGLHRLQAGENRIGTGAENEIQVPGPHAAYLGSILLEDENFRFVSADGVEVLVEEEVITEMVITTDGGGAADPTVLQAGTLRFYVIQRGDHHYLRSKDSASELRLEFDGIDRYAVDEAWRFEARWVAFDEARTVEIPNILGTSEMRTVSGRLVFEHEGEEFSLLPMGEPDQGQFVVFGDATNGIHTYGGGRFLYTDVPAEGGSVILDFNLAYNPPCAFTPYATCPLPPAGNVLPFEVRAGEKNWGEDHH